MSIEDLSTVETLDRYPFKHMVATIGNLPTSFVDSMSYYECIAWLVKYLETTVIPTVNNNSACVEELQGKFIELIALFEELKSYVDNYFENLDVQEEINNKLDEMAEAGTLTDIIAGYIQLKGILAYDTVADLKAATNVVDGSFAETYGFYEKGDGGGAKYKIRAITNDDTIDESTIIEITADPTNTLIAELVMSAEMNVKQFGCTGDGETDETNKFNKAIANCKKLYVNAGTYILNRFLPEENQAITGIGVAILKLNGDTAPLCELSSGCSISNITIESTKTNLAWNRCNISNANNISIDNCTIKGFRHDVSSPNAWGILIGNSTGINIKNCYFDSNSQSDIALVNGCKNITVDQCTGTHFFINVEPDSITNKNNNITIKNSELEKLAILENNYLGTATENILVSNCTIDTLIYDGGTTTLENCIVNDIAPQITSNVAYGGILNLVNTMNLSKNILTDPYFDMFHNWVDSTRSWRTQTMSNQIDWTMTTIKDDDGVLTVFNPDNRGNISAILEHQLIDVTAGDKFILRVNTKAKYPDSGVNYASLNYCATWVDNTNTNISTVFLSMNRGAIGTTTKMCEQSAVLVAPENAVKLRITIRLATSPSALTTGTQSLYLRSIELLKFNGGSSPNTIPKLPIRNKRIFDSDTNIGAASYNKYYAGDTLYYTSPTTYVGAVATTDGYGSNAVWKNFGALES